MTRRSAWLAAPFVALAVWLLIRGSDEPTAPPPASTVGQSDPEPVTIGSGPAHRTPTTLVAERERDTPSLPTRLRIRFVSRDDHDPLPAIGVTVVPAATDQPAIDRRDATTDARGDVVWDDVPFDLVHVLPGGEPLRLRRGESNEQTIALGPPLRVAGRVLDAFGRPAAGAEVWSTADPRHRSAAIRHARTGRDGGFALDVHGADDHAVLFALREGDTPSRVVAAVRRDDGHASVVTITLGAPGGSVVGSVVGPNGDAIPDVIVAVKPDPASLAGDPDPAALAMGIDAPAPPAAVRSGASGRFEVRDVPIGRATIEARAHGYATARSHAHVTRGNEANAIVTMHVGAILRGVARDGRGRPCADVVVTAFGTELRSTRTADDGSFEIRHLEAGRLEVEASLPRATRVTATVAAPEDGIVEWNPVLPATGSISGTLRDARDRPARNVLMVVAGASPCSARTDDAGAFSIHHVPEGEHDLVAVLDDGARVTVARSVRTGRERVAASLPDLAPADATVAGRAVDTSGRPVAGILVRAAHRELRARRTVQTGDDGTFDLGALRPGGWRLEFASPAHPEVALDLTLDAADTHALGDVELPDPVEVVVTVHREGDGPLDATLSGAGRGPVRCRVVGSRVELPPLRAGHYRLDVHGPAHAHTGIDMELVEGAAFERRIDVEGGVVRELRLEPAVDGELRLATFDAKGRELARWTQAVASSVGPLELVVRPHATRLTVITADGRSGELSLTAESNGIVLR